MWSDAIYFTLRAFPFDILTSLLTGAVLLTAGLCIGFGLVVALGATRWTEQNDSHTDVR